MGKIFEKIKTIDTLYRECLKENDPKLFEKKQKKLYKYLDRYGLANRQYPYKRLNNFLVDLNKELPNLKIDELKVLKDKYNSSMWGLQTGDIIGFEHIINIDGIPWTTQCATIIHKYKRKLTSKRSKRSKRKIK